MTLRVAILGAGGIGSRHAEAVRQLPARMQLVASCGRDPAKADAFAAMHGGVGYADFKRMLGEAEPDLLIVALPPHAHQGQVELAAQSGVHLLVEKPIGLDLGRAEDMVAATEAAGVVAACGFMYRFGAAVERWDGLAEAGETGQPGHFSGFFHSNALHASWWRERSKGGGQMVEQLIHIVDLARHSLGQPESVYARAANLFHREVDRYDSEDVSAMILNYPDGRISVLHASNIAVPGRWTKGWQIAAERMTGNFTDFNAAELVRTHPEVSSEEIAGTTDVFVAQLADVADAIAARRAPRVPLREGAHSLAIVLAARRSADEGREVAL